METPRTLEALYLEMDGTGAPMVPWELQGRRGKQPDGSAKTREVKLGCAFTQTTLDEERRPVHPPDQGKVTSVPQVGGLHHRYERRATRVPWVRAISTSALAESSSH